MNEPIDYVIYALFAFMALAMVGLVLLGGYMLGYAVGLWPATCAMESSQPKCVAAGWNGQTIHLEGKAYKVVPK